LRFQKDGSGSLSIEELKEIFGAGKIQEDVWKQMIQEVDKNQDGQVTDIL
jgi:calcium-dependent protein kinase